MRCASGRHACPALPRLSLTRLAGLVQPAAAHTGGLRRRLVQRARAAAAGGEHQRVGRVAGCAGRQRVLRLDLHHALCGQRVARAALARGGRAHRPVAAGGAGPDPLLQRADAVRERARRQRNHVADRQGPRHARLLVRAVALLAACGRSAGQARTVALSSSNPPAHSSRRLRETRVFCATADAASKAGGATVLRERSVREETFDGLRARCATMATPLLRAADACCRGAPATVAQYPDAETASQVLLAAGGPVTVTYERLDVAPPQPAA